MSSLAFDTHKFVKDLTGAGMMTEQAEVLAETYATLLTDRLATKEDIKALRGDMISLEKRLNGKMETLEERLNSKIETLEKQLNSKIETLEERLNGNMETLEERLNRRIEQAQMHTIVSITGILGFLMLVLRFYE